MRKTSDAAGSRQQLLAAGIRLFAKHGLEGTTVRDIAREAGASLCMISYHFGGKEGLYRACLEDYGRTRVARAQGLLEIPRSTEEFRVRLRLFIASLADTQASMPEFARIIAKEIEAGLPIAADIFEQTFLKVMSDVIRFFRGAQKAGLMRAECDPLFAAHILYGTIGHITRCDTIAKRYFSCTISDPKTREKLVDTLTETFTHGVSSRPARAEARLAAGAAARS